MASPIEAAPALVNLIIVINYTNTRERVHAHIVAHTHTLTHTLRQRLSTGYSFVL